MTEKQVRYAVWNVQGQLAQSVHNTADQAEQQITRLTTAAPGMLDAYEVIEVPAYVPAPNPHLEADGTPVKADPQAEKELAAELRQIKEAGAADVKARTDA